MTGIISDNVGRTSGLIKAASGGGGGVWTLIKTLTSDGSDSDLTFAHGSDDVTFDSTYPVYRFSFINIHPQTDSQNFQVNFRDGSTAYDASKMTTYFEVEHGEDGSGAGIAYNTAADLANGTGVQRVAPNVGSDADQSCSGELWFFAPSGTTFVKHFIMRTTNVRSDDIAFDSYVSGYCNTTSAIDGCQFSFASGEIQGGEIKLYGLKDSA